MYFWLRVQTSAKYKDKNKTQADEVNRFSARPVSCFSFIILFEFPSFSMQRLSAFMLWCLARFTQCPLPKQLWPWHSPLAALIPPPLRSEENPGGLSSNLWFCHKLHTQFSSLDSLEFNRMWLRVSRWVNRLSLPLSWCLKHSGKISQIDVRVYITVPGIRANKFQKKIKCKIKCY